MTDARLLLDYLLKHAVGKARATRAVDIAQALSVPSDEWDYRRVGKAAERLREEHRDAPDGILILSSWGSPPGYWIAANPEEAYEVAGQIEDRAKATLHTAKLIRDAAKRVMRKEEQMSLLEVG